MVYWASLPCKSRPSLKALKSGPSSSSFPVSCLNSLKVTAQTIAKASLSIWEYFCSVLDKVFDAKASGRSDLSGYMSDRTQSTPTGNASLANVKESSGS
ncbi:hypothetical protein AVEN_191144-1 [Araneus ventricosus]|uniref:Uncharacterized protein n=1 Tax=Araneus ventricosus TaxID=182803 RepID=A0A4Y2B072_ARAVE|nr:hypothetical protein AVEN_191144-1 [Araneus ventricosus]